MMDVKAIVTIFRHVKDRVKFLQRKSEFSYIQNCQVSASLNQQRTISPGDAASPDPRPAISLKAVYLEGEAG